MSKKLLEYLLEHFKICWKKHATAPIPGFNEEKINIKANIITSKYRLSKNNVIIINPIAIAIL